MDRGRGNNQFRNPVLEPVFADPVVVSTDDEWYYAYATMDDWGLPKDLGFRIVPIIRSKDLVTWEYVGDVFEDVPQGLDRAEAEFVWAPDINYYRGKYYLYYSLINFSPIYDDGQTNGIGIATAEEPAGPFNDHGIIFQGYEVGVPNSIDPAFFYEGNTPYLAWGSFNGIYIVELSEDGFDLVGKKTRIANNRFEGPHIIKRNGYYYLFVSSGRCCGGKNSTYQVEVGRSRNLTGPYANPNGEPLTEAPGLLVVDDNEAFGGPGHNSIAVDDRGKDYLLYHAYDRSDPSFIPGSGAPRRTLVLDPVVWREGWPTLENQEPSVTTRAPLILPESRPKKPGTAKVLERFG